MLGPLTFERDGHAVAVPSGRQRTLLALLLLAGGVPLSRDRLIDELWGDRPPSSAVSALHVHLSKLRALLGGLLLFDTAGYALAPTGFELDVWRFDELVEQARGNPARATLLLREALALFRGEPLSDLAAERSIAQWRRALEEKRLQATLQRIDADLDAGASGELVPELDRIAADHQFEERAWGQLMLALYRAGRQADALDAYQRARRVLAGELGLEPGEQLSQLHQRILERDPTLLHKPDVPREPTAEPAIVSSSLPRPLTRLFGREQELRELGALMADPDVRLVTLTGPGGVGKTRLLLELAARHELGYSDGAAFVRLEQVTDPALVAAEIASAVAHRDQTDAPTADALPNYLRDRELLLVIDNFEHLMPAAILPAELLGAAPRLRVLVSSRTPLRIRGEQVFEVDPLELPANETEQEVTDSPAVQMFLQCALASNRNLAVDASFTRTVARICRALDGLPLAIELAASRASVLAPAQIAEQLAQPLSIGRRALRDLPNRQQSLGTTIRWSYDLLSPRAQAGFLGAGAFLGGFDAGGARGDARPRSGTGARRAARDEPRPPRGRRPPVRAARAGPGVRDGRARAVRRTRADTRSPSRVLRRGWSPRRARRSTPERRPARSPAPFLADHANVRAALENAIEAGDEQSAIALALGLRPLWFAGMLRQESQELVDRLLERFSIPAAQEIALLRAVSFVEGFSPVVSSWTRRLAARAAELGDQEALATATGNLFGRAINARDRDEMRRIRPMLLAVITPEASAKALGWTHYFLALDAYVDGRFDEACEHAALSAASAAELGHEYMLATACATRLLAESARDRAIAQAALAEVLELVRPVSVQPLAAFALWFVARYAAAVAPDAAAQWLAHAERIVVAIDSELWPESILRDECLAVLSIAEPGILLGGSAPIDHGTALAEAAAWLATRDPSELAAREPVGELTFVNG